MTHRLATAFLRRVFLPALLLLLPVAASAFATSQAPVIAPTPVGRPAPGGIAGGPGAARTLTPDEEIQEGEDALDPASGASGSTSTSGPVSISIVPSPFLSITSGDQIVREFTVRNDSAKDIDVSIVMPFRTYNWRDSSLRSVSTSRKVPAHSIQTMYLFVPSYIRSDNMQSVEVVDPRIQVNGRPFRLPPGIFNTGDIRWYYYSLPSTFTANEMLLRAILKELPESTHRWNSYEEELGFSDSDTIQWPAIPQFYQAKSMFFRKTNDKFTPDAERAMNEAVMLGATEFLFVPRGSQRPGWAPEPEVRGRPVIVPRGFGRTIVLDESSFRNSLPPNPAATNGGNEDKKPFYPRRGNEPEIENMANANRTMIDYLKAQNFFLGNPAVIVQMLPCIDIPNLSFAVVILALLAYIVIVGPVNYFYLIRHRKSVLMLLFTVPAISLVFVGIVILFVTLFEGWFSRASAVGMTFLDQQESMAYTRAAVNLYAPVPVRRLVFDPIDTVSFASAKSLDISLGRDQVVTGANQARIPLIYGISRAEKRLEQLRISRNAGNTLTVMNGLGAPVRILAMRTLDARYWLPSDGMIQPGASAELKPFTGTIDAFDLELIQHAGDPEINPASFGRSVVVSAPDSERSRVTANRDRLFHALSAMLYEKAPEGRPGGNTARRGTAFYSDWAKTDMMKKVQAPAEKDKLFPLAACLSPGMYIAETDRPMFYSPGCSPASFRVRHIVVGTFTLQESAHEN